MTVKAERPGYAPLRGGRWGAGAFDALGLALAGCGGTQDTAGGQPTAGGTPATVSFSHWGTESGLGVMNR